MLVSERTATNKAFTAQSIHYDADDQSNPVISDLRKQVYDHLARFLKPNSHILELNAGTGIDAAYLSSLGHSVLATDLSDGMIRELGKKANERLRVRQLAYDHLDELNEKFDYVFSNFGGLNCIDDLGKVTRHLTHVLKPGGYVTWVIMPKVCPWEIMSALKLNRNAFRRWKKDGVVAHIDGEYFRTWYHSLKEIKKAFGKEFDFLETEGLAALSPPPHKTDLGSYHFLRSLDKSVRHTFPFNRWADHIIVTFRKP